MLKSTVSKEMALVSIHDIFSIVNKKTALQLGKLEKLSHPSVSILTPVLGAQKNHLNEAIPLSIHNMFSITNIKAKFQLIKQWDHSPQLFSNLPQIHPISPGCSKEPSQRRWRPWASMTCFHLQTRKLTWNRTTWRNYPIHQFKHSLW